MVATPQRSTVIDPNKLRIGGPDYSELEPAEARRKIKKILDQLNFGVVPEIINSATAGKQVQEEGIPARTPAKAIVQGITWVNAYNDGGENNFKVEYGQPVIFDVVTGLGVTGLNPAWGPGEYKIVGTAMGELVGGTARIPVLLGKQPSDNFSIIAKCKVDPEGEEDFPSIETWSSADTADDQNCLWSFELPKSCKFDEEATNNQTEWEGSGVFVKAFNLTRMYIYKDSLVLLHSSGKPNLQMYCEFVMCSQIMGVIDGFDLRKDDSAFIKIDDDLKGGVEGTRVKVFDKLLDAQKKIPRDAKVIANLFRCATSDDIESFTWHYFVTQANKCPIKDSTG
jgi:hypothetical protein